MNPNELNALRARFPELRGMGAPQVADALRSVPSRAAQPTSLPPAGAPQSENPFAKFRQTSANPFEQFRQPATGQTIEAELFDGTILEFPVGTDPAVIQRVAKQVTQQRRQRMQGVAIAAPASGGESQSQPVEVELPDGTLAEFPAGTDEATIKAAIQRHLAKSTEPTAENLLRAAERATAAGDTEAAKRLATAALPRLGGAGNMGERIQSGEVTYQQLMTAVRNAHNAGDTAAAERLARLAKLALYAQGNGGQGAVKYREEALPGPQEPPPAYDGVSAVPTAPRPETFGDTTGEAMAAPLAATKAFGAGLLDQSQSPTRRALPEGMDPRLKGVVAGVGDLGGMVLGGLGTGLAGAAGLVGEAVGQNRTEERQLARDLMMGLEVSAPELAGVSGTIRAGGAAVRAAENAAKPATPAQATARAAGDLGITPSAAMQGKTTAMIAAGLEKVPFAGDVIARDAARAVGEVEGAFSRIRGRIGSALSPSAAGNTLQEGLRGFVKGFQDTSRKLFDVVDRNIPADARFTLDNTATALGDAKAAFSGNPELAQRLGLNRWDAIMAEAKQNGVTWQALKQFRTSVGEAIGAAESGRQGGALAGDDLGRLKRLYGALTADMTAAAKSVGGNAFTTWSRANSHYRAGAERIERSLDATITAKSPERAWEAFSALLQRDRASSDLTRVRAIRASLSREDWDTVAASIVDRMGRAPAGQQNAAGDAFSPSAFLTNWNKLDPQSRAILLPQEARIELEKLAKVAERVRAGNAERNTSNTGTAGWVATLFLGGVTDLGTTAAVLGATNISARALTSTTFLKAINAAARGDARTIRAMANGNGPFRADAATVLRLAAADAANSPQPTNGR